MNNTLIVAARGGHQRDTLVRFFAHRYDRVVSLDRERIVSRGSLNLEGGRVLVDDEPLLDGAVAALVTDSGYMWPMPLIDPDPRTWQEQRERFDHYLRDEREAASLWYSLLGILNDRLPRCVNHQDAFFLAAARPEALWRVRQAGFPVVDSMITNDPEQLTSFAADVTGDGALFRLDLSGGHRRVPAAEVEGWPVSEEPMALARAPGGGLSRGVVVAGQLWPIPLREALPAAITAKLGDLLATLCCGWCEVTFAGRAGEAALLDYDPSPSLEWLEPGQRREVLEALHRRLEGRP